MNTAAIEKYLARFRKVLNHINTHLDEKLNIEQLSSIAAFSKYHFHRQFTELLGISVYKYVQLTRLKRASYQLAFRKDRILDIALLSGYEGPEAFARAFKKFFGQSPSNFRKNPQWASWHIAYHPLNELRNIMQLNNKANKIKIINFKETRVATLEHRGDPKLIGESIRKFIEWRKQNNLSPKVSATFNIVYDDLIDTNPDDYRFDLCASTTREVTNNAFGIIEKRIPAGRCAVLRHVGSDDNLREAVTYLYSVWLPQSGEEVRDFPLYFQRVSFFPDVAEYEAITDIFLPIK